MPLFGMEGGLKTEDLHKLRERFDSVIKGAKRNPGDFDAYYQKELNNIAIQVKELPHDEALEKALEMVENAARFELVRKDLVRGLLDGTI